MSRQDNRNYQRLLEEIRSQRIKESSSMKLSPKETALLALATVLAFAGLAIDDFLWLGGFLFVSWVIFVILCFTNPRLTRNKALWSLVITCIYVFMGFYMNDRRIKQRRDDVDLHLSVSASVPENGIVTNSVFRFVNGGKTDISVHQMYCIVRYMIDDHYRVIDMGDSSTGVRLLRPAGMIRAGGEGESTPCLELFQLGNILCADVVVGLHYEIAGQIGIQNDRRFRLVLIRKQGMEWNPQPLDLQGTYCNVRDAKP